MLILLLLMAFALAAGCWAYSYVWRGLNRRHCRREGGRPDDYARPVHHGGVGGVHGSHRHEHLGDRNPAHRADDYFLDDCRRLPSAGLDLALMHCLGGRPWQTPDVVA